MDNSALARWRGLDAAAVLQVLAAYAKEDTSYRERGARGTTRWHANIGGAEVEVLCTGSKFYETRSRKGGGGAVDMAMNLLGLDFKQASAALRNCGL